MLGPILDYLRSLATPPDDQQIGAIPYAVRDERRGDPADHLAQVGRLDLPQGGAMAGLSDAEAAAQEAWEEAGVRGATGPAIGSYHAVKQRDGRQVRLKITMFPLRVEEELDDWPERAERKRRWATVREARRLLRDPGLARLVTRLAARV